MNICSICKEPVTGNYCSNCGRPALLKRINGRYVMHELGDFFVANKGMIYTVKNLLIRPGDSVRRYLTEDRSQFVKPITFAIITSLIYTLVCHLLHIEAANFQMQQSNEIELPSLNRFINWMIDYQGYFSLLIGFFIAFWLKLFFRKSGYNLYEIFVFLCYITGIPSLIFSVILTFQVLVHQNFIPISAFIALIYQIWATGQFFNKRKVTSYIKALFSYVLALFVLSISATTVIVFIDIIIK